MIFESLLGPRAAEFDLTLRCDIMFPEGDVTTLELDDGTGSELPLSRLEEKRPAWSSVGVGGVLTINGAVVSPEGGVCGLACVSMGWGTFEFRGGSDEKLTGPNCWPCFSNILDTTLPRLLCPVLSFACTGGTPTVPVSRSGLRLGLGSGLTPRRAFSFSRNLPTGEGDRFWDLSLGARSLSEAEDEAESEAATMLTESVDLDLEVVPSSVWICDVSGIMEVVCTRGDDVVR